MCEMYELQILQGHILHLHIPFLFPETFPVFFRARIYVGSKYNTEILVAFREFWWSKTTLDYSICSRESRKKTFICDS